MIIFEFELETHDINNQLKSRPIYWLGTTKVTGIDSRHEDEIYEQLEAEQVFNI